jgi:hypothetical protein
MDREMLQRHFEQAEAHVAEGVRHIAEQQERIAKLALLGSNIDLAKELLSTFCATQAQHIQNRDRVRAELKQPANGETLRRSYQRLERSYQLIARSAR